jgi:hypothetical protein
MDRVRLARLDQAGSGLPAATGCGSRSKRVYESVQKVDVNALTAPESASRMATQISPATMAAPKAAGTPAAK